MTDADRAAIAAALDAVDFAALAALTDAERDLVRRSLAPAPAHPAPAPRSRAA